MAIARAMGQRPAAPAANPDSQYRLGPDSQPQEGVPKGEIRGPYTLPSQVYPGTQHTYWVYVPAQYHPAVPAAIMVFQDGQAFEDEKGDMRAQNVMDNLIYRREIPVMIGVFINPGRRRCETTARTTCSSTTWPSSRFRAPNRRGISEGRGGGISRLHSRGCP
jgi:enterochelin esterase family protein